jgi:hypothetical protein
MTRGTAHQDIELRHLRYLVAVADAGTFTLAAERLFVSQPTLSQQVRRLEEKVGTRLLDRGRDGVRLTEAGTVLVDESRLRFALPPGVPERLAVPVAARLRSPAPVGPPDAPPSRVQTTTNRSSSQSVGRAHGNVCLFR